WEELWEKAAGDVASPSGRVGHSMVLHGTRVVLFAGRDNETYRPHTPRTYEIHRTDGSLEFINYNEKPVLQCQADIMAGLAEESEECSLEVRRLEKKLDWQTLHLLPHTPSIQVPVGLYYNDVWVYDLDCNREGDGPCTDSGWDILHPGGCLLGGCKFYRGQEICNLPSERYGHGAALFDDSTMLIYGGYSHLCADYCDDVWSFDLRDNTWMGIYGLGALGTEDGPGKRWKFSMAFNGEVMIIFGGHRLWHGFATDNSQDNMWDSTEQLPRGGYLDDMWIYTKRQLAADELVPTDSTGYGWEDRNDITCSLAWPAARAGHVSVWDKDLSGMWLHGGYTTYFPYISTDGAGGDVGVSSIGKGGFKPFADYPFYLDDLWFYNMSDGRWKQ
ncbi:unnamed protein product, partial [Chrysoparadoxa australica]